MVDLILYNGKLYPQPGNHSPATAIAIRSNRIVAIGNDADMRNLADGHTRQIDLKGRLVLPGLTDSHFHFYDWALGRRRLELAGMASLTDLLASVARWADKTPPGRWIIGQGWNEVRWPEQSFPTRADLDPLTPANPVILWRSDGHLAVANSLALQAANIRAGTPDPPAGLIGRDNSEHPTGVLKDLAINIVREVIPLPDDDEIVSALREGIPVLHQLGLTGLHDTRIMGGAEGPLAFRAYQRMDAGGELNLRLWMMLPGERLNEAIETGLQTGFGSDSLQVGHVKFFSDGGQGARTAWMLDDYEDTPSRGMPLTPMSEISDAVHRANKAGLALAIHAIGDRANHELAIVFEKLASDTKASGGSTPRAPNRIEHLQIIRPEDVVRLGRVGVVASVQPIHVTDDYPMVDRSVGPRGRYAYPFKDLLDAGVNLAFGSDSPVASPNPLWGIHAAVTRQMRDGTPKGGWFPAQCLSVDEAVQAYTMGPAIATGREAELGSLAPTKFADLIVTERDIFTIDPMEIADTRVAMTIFDGQIVFGE